MSTYEKMICQQLNSYRESCFGENSGVFDQPPGNTSRPPVFLGDWADLNVLKDPSATEADKQRLMDLLPRQKRHRWFSSMKSSQALAQSLFGNLIVSDKLGLLSTIRSDDGRLMFGIDKQPIKECSLEHAISHNPLKEVAPTEVDVFFPGEYQVAVECKFTENSIGECSIPLRKPKECDGNLQDRSKSAERCYLKGKDIKYWEHVPKLFNWKYESDYFPCPLRSPYQLVRNILAACIREDENISPNNGHTVLIFDDRNPAFKTGGKGDQAWQECKDALEFPHLLQRCSWQTIVNCLRDDSELGWLTDEIAKKYDIV